MAGRQKYFLVAVGNTDALNEGSVEEFDSREDAKVWLEENMTTENAEDHGPYDKLFRLFKGQEVEIEAESEGIKVTLTDCSC